jgi:hypothetical protein
MAEGHLHRSSDRRRRKGKQEAASRGKGKQEAAGAEAASPEKGQGARPARAHWGPLKPIGALRAHRRSPTQPHRQQQHATTAAPCQRAIPASRTASGHQQGGLPPDHNAGRREALVPRRPLHRCRSALSGGCLGRRRGEGGGEEGRRRRVARVRPLQSRAQREKIACPNSTEPMQSISFRTISE